MRHARSHRRLTTQRYNRNFAYVSRIRHARSPQRVDIRDGPPGLPPALSRKNEEERCENVRCEKMWEDVRRYEKKTSDVGGYKKISHVKRSFICRSIFMSFFLKNPSLRRSREKKTCVISYFLFKKNLKIIWIDYTDKFCLLKVRARNFLKAKSYKRVRVKNIFPIN